MTNWKPDPRTLARPAYLSLAEQFARAIESGALPVGGRLMPHRKLADDLGLSVQTVSRAYEELIRRGLIAGEVGRGSFVLGAGAEARQPYLPERPGEVVDLSILKPVAEPLHLERLRQGFGWLAEHLASASALSFRPNTVLPQHRATAADWLNRIGIPAEAQNIAITNGATPAITAALMGVGAARFEGLLPEALTHHTLMPLCSYLGLHLEGVAMDGQGMLPAALDEVARRGLIRAVYLQPNVINPLACQMGADRRGELVELARRHDLAIIENDILECHDRGSSARLCRAGARTGAAYLRFHQDHRAGAAAGLSFRPAAPCHGGGEPASGCQLDGHAAHGRSAEPLGAGWHRGRAGGLAAAGDGRPPCHRRRGAGAAETGQPSAQPAPVAAPARGPQRRGFRGRGAQSGRGSGGGQCLSRDRKGAARFGARVAGLHPCGRAAARAFHSFCAADRGIRAAIACDLSRNLS
ncbi:MAG: PLP-dependent aminotransferase family protein [Gemmobacter sp.]|nr:PLP-dependent aminotransferase family protein [Gemmobacter sp.]